MHHLDDLRGRQGQFPSGITRRQGRRRCRLRILSAEIASTGSTHEAFQTSLGEFDDALLGRGGFVWGLVFACKSQYLNTIWNREVIKNIPLDKSRLIWSLITFSIYGVSPKGKYGGMRLCQTSGAGMVSKKGFSLCTLSPFIAGRNWGFVDERAVPRPGAEGWSKSKGFTDGLAGWSREGRLAGDREPCLLGGLEPCLLDEREACLDGGRDVPPVHTYILVSR